MRTMFQNKKAFAVMEYVLLIIVIIGSFISLKMYLQRGYQGQIYKAGEMFAFGRQYDPHRTIACAYDEAVNKAGNWYSTACYEHEYALKECTRQADSYGCGLNAMRACVDVCKQQ